MYKAKILALSKAYSLTEIYCCGHNGWSWLLGTK